MHRATSGLLAEDWEGWYAMPVDLPPKENGGEIAPAYGVLARILNWTAVVISIGLGWWAVVYGIS